MEKIDEQTARVTGNLTLLGVSHQLQVDVDVQRAEGNGRLGFIAKARIDRLAFGMNAGYPIISRDLDLIVTSEATAQ